MLSKVIIPVAGLGTRVLPASKAIPKEMLPVVDKPVIQHVVEEAMRAGFRHIVLVTRSGKEAIENHFDAHYELEQMLVLKTRKRCSMRLRTLCPRALKLFQFVSQALRAWGMPYCALRMLWEVTTLR